MILDQSILEIKTWHIDDDTLSNAYFRQKKKEGKWLCCLREDFLIKLSQSVSRFYF